MQTYAVSIDKSGIVPASKLDNVLIRKRFINNVEVSFYDFLEGNKLTDANRSDFYRKVKYNVANKIYPTIDHLITCVKIEDIYFLYVSLDNCYRTSKTKHDLTFRLPNILDVIDRILEQLNRMCVLFFSEACKRSQNLRWIDIRRTISNVLNLEFLTERRNIDYDDESSGISAFCCTKVSDRIDGYMSSLLLEKCYFGSQTVCVRLTSGVSVWSVHFPIDFDRTGSKNKGYQAMINLQKVLYRDSDNVCAIGDFNTIPGKIEEAIKLAIDDDFFEFSNKDTLTFFGSYLDVIKERPGEIATIIN